jgi:CDP-diacylglycerol---serine O-phosphatidyltransferase
VAPAMVLYASILDQARSFGWIAALVYVVACGLRLARFNVMADDPNRPAWSSDFFVGVPAPFGAFLVMLPLYVNFLGLESGKGLALAAALYTVVIALLMISQIPIFSGKSAFARVPGHVILPALLLATVYVALLLTFTWETLTVSAVFYFLSMPFGIAAFKKRLAEDRRQTAETSIDG